MNHSFDHELIVNFIERLSDLEEQVSELSEIILELRKDILENSNKN
jgi:hypothetical protein